MSQEEVAKRLRKAKGASCRAMQKLGGLTQLAEEVGLMVNCKPVTTLMELNFQKLCGSNARPDLGNAFELHKFIRIDVLGELPSGYMFCS